MLALLVVACWLVYLLAPVITPFAISAVLAYFGDPLVDRLQKVSVWRWKVGRTLAVIIVFVLIAIIYVGIPVLLISFIIRMFKYFKEAAKERKLLRIEMGKLAEEVQLLRKQKDDENKKSCGQSGR